MTATQNGLAYEIASKAGIEFQNREMRAILDQLADWVKRDTGTARDEVARIVENYQAKPLDTGNGLSPDTCAPGSLELSRRDAKAALGTLVEYFASDRAKCLVS